MTIFNEMIVNANLNKYSCSFSTEYYKIALIKQGIKKKLLSLEHHIRLKVFQFNIGFNMILHDCLDNKNSILHSKKVLQFKKCKKRILLFIKQQSQQDHRTTAFSLL